MFAEKVSANILKYVSVGQIFIIIIEILERIFQLVADRDKLGKCSFKHFYEHFRNLTYTILL